MTARLLDGTATLRTIQAELTERVASLKERGITPGLGTILVGDDPGSHWYVGAKHKDCASIGITSIRRDLPGTATQAEVEAVIDELNADPARTGFLVQQPTGLAAFALLARVEPASSWPRPGGPGSSPAPWSDPGRRCSTWASRGSTGRSPATSRTTWPRSPAGCRPTRAGWGR